MLQKKRNTFLNQQRAVDIQKSFSDVAREGTLRIFSPVNFGYICKLLTAVNYAEGF